MGQYVSGTDGKSTADTRILGGRNVTLTPGWRRANRPSATASPHARRGTPAVATLLVPFGPFLPERRGGLGFDDFVDSQSALDDRVYHLPERPPVEWNLDGPVLRANLDVEVVRVLVQRVKRVEHREDDEAAGFQDARELRERSVPVLDVAQSEGADDPVEGGVVGEVQGSARSPWRRSARSPTRSSAWSSIPSLASTPTTSAPVLTSHSVYIPVPQPASKHRVFRRRPGSVPWSPAFPDGRCTRLTRPGRRIRRRWRRRRPRR